MALKHLHAVQEGPEVEVEYVSAPHEYEELLQSEPEPEPESDAAGTAGLGSSGGGLGFVSAGTSGAGSGLPSPIMKAGPDRYDAPCSRAQKQAEACGLCPVSVSCCA